MGERLKDAGALLLAITAWLALEVAASVWLRERRRALARRQAERDGNPSVVDPWIKTGSRRGTTE